jgi:O-antigen/teichoic acid export membrane protein
VNGTKADRDYGRNVVTVMTGTIIAQVIPVAASPVITRLYTPEDLGILALYASTIAIGSVLATGRFELAILIPRRDREAFDLLLVCIAMSIGTSIVGSLVLLGWNVGTDASLPWWVLVVPIGVLLAGVFQGLSYWTTRAMAFRRLVAGRVVQSASLSAAQVLGGLVAAGPSGLLGGHVLAQAIANAILIREVVRKLAHRFNRTLVLRLLAAIRRHRRFPKFMVPGQLANVASSQMPVLMLGALFEPSVAGLYSIAERVLILPSLVIGSAIGDVYRQKSTADYRTYGNCRTLFLTTAKRLALLSFVPMLLVAWFGPGLFSFIFGAPWRTAGELSAVLSVMVFFQILSSPMSQTVLLANMHRLDMLWQIARLVASAGSIYLGYAVWNSFHASVVLYTFSFSALYAIHSLFQYQAACGSSSRTR